MRKGQLLETVTQAERDFFKVINLFDIGDRVAAHTAERPAVSQIYMKARGKDISIQVYVLFVWPPVPLTK